MMYGATGSLDIPTVFETLHKGVANPQVLVFGLVFIVAGLAFKLGLAPFHMWVPDVYQGAPTAVTLLISGAPKLAAFGITFRILVEGLSGQAPDWQQMLIVLSVVSMSLGNLAAIAQSNLKRLLAYSAIAQLGFMLLGFTPTVINVATANAANGYSSALFYIITYVLTTLGTFGLIMVLSRNGFESEEITDLAGLGKRAPWIAGVMAIFMFSLGLHHPGGGRGAAVADRRVLLPAHRQDDVLRRAGRHRADPRRSRRHRVAGAQRPGGAGLRRAAGRPDDGLPRGRRQGADDLMTQGVA
jgi:NADH-quinone oxidoreductase subunit N